jgi:phosphoribosyl-ATP pyrophosphohydrolase/phosphoribosyl-AMP cyclohydrolase
MRELIKDEVDFNKSPDGLIPAIIQDFETKKVLMLGFMNEEALRITLSTQKVTFYSRTKSRLWTKGETSNNFLHLKSIALDCDKDTLLIKVQPDGPTCHTGTDTCWGETNNQHDITFITHLEQTITERKNNPSETSYTSSLFAKGINKIAQKVGEEAVEIVIEAKDNNDDLFLGEAADLLFHYLVLLQAKGFTTSDVIKILKERHQ